MMRTHIQHGEGPCGLPLMKFTLTYEGELKSNDKPKSKWEIRKQIHPQLNELWSTNPTLKQVRRGRRIPKDGYFQLEAHHSLPQAELHSPIRENEIDLCAPVVRGGRQFWPLIRESYALTCALRILFLRAEEPGRIYQGGDIDNRLKTLLDALAVPRDDTHVIADASLDDPIYCLLEDDALIIGLDIATHRLLAPKSVSKHEVKLIIEVDVRVSQSRIYNHPFLGD